MTAEELIITIIVSVLCIYMILIAAAPEKTDKPFWIGVNKVRNVTDLISYYAMTGCLILAAIFSVI